MAPAPLRSPFLFHPYSPIQVNVMSTQMRQLDTKFVIRHTHFHKAHEAVLAVARKLPREIRYVTTSRLLRATTLPEALHVFRWNVKTDGDIDLVNALKHDLDHNPAWNTRDVLGVVFAGENLGDEHELFNALAPFVEAGSFIEVEGDEGARWRWYFDGVRCHEQQARVVYGEAPDANRAPGADRLSEVSPPPTPWKRQAGSATPDEPGGDEISLRKRAWQAEEAVRCYAAKTGFNYEDEEDREQCVMQLLGDIRHLCDREDFDYDELADEAEKHYDAEIDGEDVGC